MLGATWIFFEFNILLVWVNLRVVIFFKFYFCFKVEFEPNWPRVSQSLIDCQNGRFNKIVWVYSEFPPIYWYNSIPIKSNFHKFEKYSTIEYLITNDCFVSCISILWSKIHGRIWNRIFMPNMCHWQCNNLLDIHLASKKHFRIHRNLWRIYWKKFVLIFWDFWRALNVNWFTLISFWKETIQQSHIGNWLRRSNYFPNFYAIPFTYREHYFYFLRCPIPISDILFSIWERNPISCLFLFGLYITT